MDDRVGAHQWSCDVPCSAWSFPRVHVAYAPPLVGDEPDLILPPFALVVSFGLGAIGVDDSPIEMPADTHKWTRSRAEEAIDAGRWYADDSSRRVPSACRNHYLQSAGR